MNAPKIMARAMFLFSTISFQVFSGVSFSIIKYPINRIIIHRNENKTELIIGVQCISPIIFWFICDNIDKKFVREWSFGWFRHDKFRFLRSRRIDFRCKLSKCKNPWKMQRLPPEANCFLCSLKYFPSLFFRLWIRWIGTVAPFWFFKSIFSPIRKRHKNCHCSHNNSIIPQGNR